MAGRKGRDLPDGLRRGRFRTAAACEVTDTDAAQDFIDERSRRDGGGEPEDASYEGVDYKLDTDGDAAGIVDEFFVLGRRGGVQGSGGRLRRRLAEPMPTRTRDRARARAEGSLADVYVDFGALIEESGEEIDPETRKMLREAAASTSMIATALASLVPGSDRVEIDVDQPGSAAAKPPGPRLRPARLAAGRLARSPLRGSDFGKSARRSDRHDRRGGHSRRDPAGQLKSTLKKAGIDLDRIAG